MLGPLVEAYYRRYPGVKLLIQEMNQERMETMLLEDELDVGFALTSLAGYCGSAAADGNPRAGGEPRASAGS
jgi:DNA-binding transcriptional LysR family regulator